MTSVRGHNLADVIAALEGLVGGDQPGRSVRHRYLLCGFTLVPMSRAAIEPRSVARCIRGRAWRPIVLPLASRRIVVKNNLRVFGYARGGAIGLTAKVALQSAGRPGALRREIRARTFVLPRLQPSFNVPRLCRYDRAHARWLVEEELHPRRTAPALLEEFLFRHAVPFYGSTSRLRPVSRRMIAAVRSEIISEADDSLGGMDLTALLNSEWPIAFCHGDLSEGNMLRDEQERLSIVDWEKALVGPVASDLRAIFLEREDARPAVRALLTSLSGGSERALPPDLQMGLALLAHAAVLRKDAQRRTAYAMAVHGLPANRAEQHCKTTIARNVDLARDLIGGART